MFSKFICLTFHINIISHGMTRIELLMVAEEWLCWSSLALLSLQHLNQIMSYNQLNYILLCVKGIASFKILKLSARYRHCVWYLSLRDTEVTNNWLKTNRNEYLLWCTCGSFSHLYFSHIYFLYWICFPYQRYGVSWKTDMAALPFMINWVKPVTLSNGICLQ